MASQSEHLKHLEKTAHRLGIELATREGRELHASGQRRVTQRGPIDEAMRARAQAFVAGGGAVFLAVSDDPPAVLLAVSPDAGVNAGERVKAAVTAVGGRGGGNPGMAQGSAPSAEALKQVLEQLS